MNTTTSSVTPIRPNPKQPQPRQTAKETIAANVKSPHRAVGGRTQRCAHGLPRAMSRFHNYSFGNILEIARQRPDATRVAGLYAWNQLGRNVKKGEKGIRILAPIVGVKRKKDEKPRRTSPSRIPRLRRLSLCRGLRVSQTEGQSFPTCERSVAM